MSSTQTFILFSQKQIEQDITEFLASVSMPSNLKEAAIYATMNGGKRIRPALVYASYLSCSANHVVKANTYSFPASVRRCAIALELLHCYSLVHDDMPCMDDDDLRRGKPSCHKQFDEGVALLCGDILQSLSFEVLTSSFAKGDDSKSEISINNNLEALNTFSKSARRMVSGQMRDVNAENKHENITQAELEAIHIDKTGALIEAAVIMGAIHGGSTQEQLAKLNNFAKNIGLAFQVQDDILDITATTEELGKPAGSDEKLNKATYPKLMGIEGAKAYANELFINAKNELSFLETNSALAQLADWLWARKN